METDPMFEEQDAKLSNEDTERTRSQLQHLQQSLKDDLLRSEEVQDDGKVPDIEDFREHQMFWNFQPLIPPSYRKDSKFCNILDLEDALLDYENNVLYSLDNVCLLTKDDTIYTMASNVGEPYYICRVVRFEILPKYKQVVKQAIKINKLLPYRYFQMRVNWFYRRRDIRNDNVKFDPRRVYATQMEDVVPIEVYRGKCVVCHESELLEKVPSELEVFQRPNIFYFDELFDIYSNKLYKVYPTSILVHEFANSSYLYLMNKRTPYIFCETSFPLDKAIVKYLIDCNYTESDMNNSHSWDKSCQQCYQWCDFEVDLTCDGCNRRIHLKCLDLDSIENLANDTVWLCHICMELEMNDIESIKKASELQSQELLQRSRCIEFLENQSKELSKGENSLNFDNYWFYYFGQNTLSKLELFLKLKIFLPYPIDDNLQIIVPWKSWSVHPYTNRALNSYELINENTVFQNLKLSKNTSSRTIEFIQECLKYLKVMLETEISSHLEETLLFILSCYDYNESEANNEIMMLAQTGFFDRTLFSEMQLSKFKFAVQNFGNELQLIQQYLAVDSLDAVYAYYNLFINSNEGRGSLMTFRNLYSPAKNYVVAAEEVHNLISIESLENLVGYQNLITEVSKYRPNFVSTFVDDSSVDIEDPVCKTEEIVCALCHSDLSAMWYKYSDRKSDFEANIMNKSEPHTRAIRIDPHKTNVICMRCARIWRRYGLKWQNPISVLKELTEGYGVEFDLFLVEILEEQNENKFKSSPVDAHRRFLEYELVQDAEMIVKQRDSVISNMGKAERLQTRVPTLRKLYYKFSKRTLDTNQQKPIRMNYDLITFLKDQKQ